jgi:hypothetical protein
VCAAEIEDLHLVLATLAELPEPELPAEVAVRLDAAIARAWQEADAEQASAPTPVRSAAQGRRRISWSKLALPIGGLGVLVLAGVGIGYAVSQSGVNASSASGSAAQGGADDTALSQWVHSVLPEPAAAGTAGTAAPDNGPQVQPEHKSTAQTQNVPTCPSYPQRAGYSVLTTAAKQFDGEPATLVVYQNDTGPASNTVFAVVYAGPCPTSSSQILDEGSVSR